MPVAAGPQAYHSQLPSFMSVYSCNAPNMDTGAFVESPQQSEVAAAIGDDSAAAPSSQSQSREDDNSATASPAPEPELQHKHRDSTSTQASESTDSSPTTTISTADSSALTDPSPSSSPESPVIILPLSSFSSKGFGIHSLDDLTMSDNPILRDSFDRPMTSPSPRKPRNAKGLALKLGSLDPLVQVSAPASPAAFVKPPLPKPRKKPSNLSLQTSSNFSTTALPSLSLEPPPTPAGLRVTMLHHAASTSDMGMFSPDLRSSMAGPQGGMRLPGFERSQISGLSNAFRKPTPILESRAAGQQQKFEEISPIRTQLATRSGGDIGGDTFDCAANDDIKSPGYPDGPIAIYEPYVFLYLEPSADEAAEFDVVMNVASEVKNPFKVKQALEESKSQAAEPKSFDAMDIDRESPPMTGASMATFTTAFEVQPNDASTPTETSPTTPKPLSKEPEYIHIPWEHNTDISKDLLSLCETIDDRVNHGKKVLIHCQQGASRSASLIIAYGMYRNPSLTVDAAYNAAQAKSKYVSPNINLMYALQDFRKTLQARQPKMGRSPNKHRMALSVDEIDFNAPSNKESPRTAPLPSDPSSRASPVAVGSPPHARGNSTPNLRELSPGPSSAPTFTWPEGDPKSMLLAGPLSDSGARPGRGFELGEEVGGRLAPPGGGGVVLRPPPSPGFPPAMGFARAPSPPPQAEESEPRKQQLIAPIFPKRHSSIPHPQPQLTLDTPPPSQSSSPPPPPAPPSLGFAAHREGKRKMKPTLSFVPAHPLRAAPSLPNFSSSSQQQSQIQRQPTYPPPAVPESPTLWSPRVIEAPVVTEQALWSPRLPASSFQLPSLPAAGPLPSFFQTQPVSQNRDGRPRTAVGAVPPPISSYAPSTNNTNSTAGTSGMESMEAMGAMDTPPTPTLMSPIVGDFGIQPFAEVFAADPGTERLQQAPGFRKKKSAVFVKGGLDKELPSVPGVPGGVGGVGGKGKELPPLPGGFLAVGDFGGVSLGGGRKEEEVVDPRSPGMGSWGEGVVRSIDDVL